MAPYRVDEAPMDAANLGALLLRRLPAHRGEEVTDAATDGPRLAVEDRAESRLHARRTAAVAPRGMAAPLQQFEQFVKPDHQGCHGRHAEDHAFQNPIFYIGYACVYFTI